MSKFTQAQQTDQFYEKHKGKPFFSDLAAFMQSDVCTGLELVGDRAVERFRELLGPTDVTAAKTEAPGTLRATFGTDTMRNAVHASGSAADYQNEKSLFFSPNFAPTAAFNNCTCAIIKPHIV